MEMPNGGNVVLFWELWVAIVADNLRIGLKKSLLFDPVILLLEFVLINCWETDISYSAMHILF